MGRCWLKVPNILLAGKCYVFVRRSANVNLAQLDQNDLPRIFLKCWSTTSVRKATKVKVAFILTYSAWTSSYHVRWHVDLRNTNIMSRQPIWDDAALCVQILGFMCMLPTLPWPLQIAAVQKLYLIQLPNQHGTIWSWLLRLWLSEPIASES